MTDHQPPLAAADGTVLGGTSQPAHDGFGALALAFSRLFCRVRVRGRENLAGLGGRVLFVANHVTFLDPVLVRVALGRDVAFAIDPQMAALPWVRPFARLADTAPVDPAHPFAIRSLLRALAENRPAMIFPEGRLTMTGSLMHLYDGAAFLAARSGAAVVPIHLEGLERSYLTRMSDAEGRRVLRPTAAVTIGKPFRIVRSAGTRWRDVTAQALRPAMLSHAVVSAAEAPATFLDRLLTAAQARPRGAMAVSDGVGGSMSARRFLAEARHAADALPGGRIVPLAAGSGLDTLRSIVGLWLAGRVPALHDGGTLPTPFPADPGQAALLVSVDGRWHRLNGKDLLALAAGAGVDLPLDARDRVYQPLPWRDENVLVRGFLSPWLLGASVVAYGGRRTPAFQNEAIYIANATVAMADPPLAEALIAAARPFDLRTVRAFVDPRRGEVRQLDWRRAG